MLIFFHCFVFTGNIFIHRNPKVMLSPESGLESCEEDEELEEAVVYKIGMLLSFQIFIKLSFKFNTC